MEQRTTIKYSQPGKKVIGATVLTDGTCEIILETINFLPEVTVFVRGQEVTLLHIQASKLGTEDTIFNFQPRTAVEWISKIFLLKHLKKGVRDFYIPKYAASFNRDDSNICFIPDGLPPLGKSYDWWEEIAKGFAPKYNSHLCTIPQYYALWAVLLKELVSSGWKVSDAWHAICTNYSKLLNNPYATPESLWKEELFGLHNLFGYFKYLAYDQEIRSFGLAAGCFSSDAPLRLCFGQKESVAAYNCIGFVVFETINPL